MESLIRSFVRSVCNLAETVMRTTFVWLAVRYIWAPLGLLPHVPWTTLFGAGLILPLLFVGVDPLADAVWPRPRDAADGELRPTVKP